MRNVFGTMDLTAMVSLLASCAMREPADPSSGTSSPEARAAAMRELQEIGFYLTEHLHDRGVTMQEAWVVAESGDEEAARELLGMGMEEAQQLPVTGLLVVGVGSYGCLCANCWGGVVERLSP